MGCKMITSIQTEREICAGPGLTWTQEQPGQTQLRKFRSLLQGISAGFDLLALIYLRVIDSQGGHEALKIQDDQKHTENIHHTS